MSRSADDTTVRGRSADEFAQACTQEHTVAGVELPGDVAAFVRDDDAGDPHAWPPTAAAWRCTKEAVVVVVYAAEVYRDGTPKDDAMWVAEIRRWSPEHDRYVAAGNLTADTALASFPPVLRGALRAGSMDDAHALEALQDYGDALGAWA